MGWQGDPSTLSSGGQERGALFISQLQPVVWDSCLVNWFLEAPPGSGRKELVSAEASPFLMLGVEGATAGPSLGTSQDRLPKRVSPFPSYAKTGFVFSPTLELCDNPGIIRSFSQKLGSRHME